MYWLVFDVDRSVRPSTGVTSTPTPNLTVKNPPCHAHCCMHSTRQ
nr:hypothetical protein [Edwardsiella ictaluri]